MIDVGMRKDDVVDFGGVETEVPVHGIGFEAFALKHSAIEEDLFSVFSGNEMFAAGNLTGSAEEFEFHILAEFLPDKLDSVVHRDGLAGHKQAIFAPSNLHNKLRNHGFPVRILSVTDGQNK